MKRKEFSNIIVLLTNEAFAACSPPHISLFERKYAMEVMYYVEKGYKVRDAL